MFMNEQTASLPEFIVVSVWHGDGQEVLHFKTAVCGFFMHLVVTVANIKEKN